MKFKRRRKMKATKPKKGFAEGYAIYDTSKGYGSKRKWQKAFYQRMTGDEAAAILADQEASPYEILGVSKEATQEQIRAAFRKLIVIWHPDKNPTNLVQAEAMSKKIIAAYTILKK